MGSFFEGLYAIVLGVTYASLGHLYEVGAVTSRANPDVPSGQCLGVLMADGRCSLCNEWVLSWTFRFDEPIGSWVETRVRNLEGVLGVKCFWDVTLFFYLMASHRRASFLQDCLLYSIGVHELRDFFCFWLSFSCCQSHPTSCFKAHNQTLPHDWVLRVLKTLPRITAFLSPNPPIISQDQLPTLSDARNGSGFTLAREVKASQKRPQGD